MWSSPARLLLNSEAPGKLIPRSSQPGIWQEKGEAIEPRDALVARPIRAPPPPPTPPTPVKAAAAAADDDDDE